MGLSTYVDPTIKIKLQIVSEITSFCKWKYLNITYHANSKKSHNNILFFYVYDNVNNIDSILCYLFNELISSN